MKKTLYIGFYDYSYGYGAYELKDKEFKNIDLTFKEFDSLNYLECKFEDNKERRIKILSTIESILNSYDEIIICDDGVFDYYDTTELSYELHTLRK